MLWSQEDEDIPKGDIGEVIRLDDGKLSIQWPKGLKYTEVTTANLCFFWLGAGFMKVLNACFKKWAAHSCSVRRVVVSCRVFCQDIGV